MIDVLFSVLMYKLSLVFSDGDCPASTVPNISPLNEQGRYIPQIMENNGRYWIESLQLFLGVWQGEREHRSGYWLRWWNQ